MKPSDNRKVKKFWVPLKKREKGTATLDDIQVDEIQPVSLSICFQICMVSENFIVGFAGIYYGIVGYKCIRKVLKFSWLSLVFVIFKHA